MNDLVAGVDKAEKAVLLANKNKKTGNEVQSIPPKFISNWEFRDRQDFELGDINALAESIKNNGQAQPIIIVEKSDIFKEAEKNEATKYVVIAGYRRWMACQEAGINVEAIVKSLTFDQAVSCLLTENDKEIVSDYSKGMFYTTLYNGKKVKRELFDKLGLSKSVFNNFLAFGEVPSEVWDAVGDLRKVSARTAGEIKHICQKGPEALEAILAIADKIAIGIGARKINKLVDSIINKKKKAPSNAIQETNYMNGIKVKSHDDKLILNIKKCSPEFQIRIKKHIDQLLNDLSA